MCAICGGWGMEHATDLVYFGLHAMQHRGEESAGIAAADGEAIRVASGEGHVEGALGPDPIRKSAAHSAIGQTRYSTTPAKGGNIQPLFAATKRGPIALAHNGNITNYGTLRAQLEDEGAIFSTTSDTEVLLHLLAHSRQQSLEDAIAETFAQIRGAASVLALTPHALYAMRDRHGFRPLAIGELNGGNMLASETCAFDLVGARYLDDVQPGELIRFDAAGMHRHPRHLGAPTPHYCIFEHVYFARPDSKVFGENVDRIRRHLGKRLGQEGTSSADIAIPIPDSSNTTALGYCRTSGVKAEIGLIRNHYVGRTFIRPTDAARELGVRTKFNTVKGVLEGRRVDVIDDSIVRGTTAPHLVQLIRQAGATEVHLRIASPPVTGSCYYGIDTPRPEELASNKYSREELVARTRADSLTYLSLDGLRSCVDNPDDYCMACFDGRYPEPVGP